MHQLALARSRKAVDYTAKRKIAQGYPPAMFNNFIVKGDYCYVIKHVIKYRDTPAVKVWQALQSHIESVLVERGVAKELLLVGELINEEGMLVTHACTFIRVARKTSRRREYSVVLLLDSNYPKPQCNKPTQLVEDSALLKWQTHFEAYKEVSLFQLH